MDYKQVVEYIYNLERFGMKLGLHNIRYLLERMGHPERSYKVIHIAGTNGKGSTAALVYSILRAAGYSTALYTSPHLIDFRERFVVNGRQIPKAEIMSIFKQMRPILEEMGRPDSENNHPTFFEMTTALGLQFFANKKVDFAVIEVGLGGRLDATNAIETPIASAIVTISKEHTQVLGDTEEMIAFEKAGIIKKGAPVVVGVPRDKQAGAFGVLEKLARERGAPLITAGTYPEADIRFDVSSDTAKGLVADYHVKDRELAGVKVPLVGTHQALNAAMAIGLIESIKMKEPQFAGKLTDEIIKDGLKKAKWPGRLELRKVRGREMLFDAAHNPEAFRSFLAALDRYFTTTSKILIFAVMRDKNHKAWLPDMVPRFRKIIIMKPKNPRSQEPQQIRDDILALNLKPAEDILVKEGVKDAVEAAFALAQEGELVCNAGSIFCIGEVMEYLKNYKPQGH